MRPTLPRIHALAHARRGSFLLVCLALMSLMVILGFAMLRSIQLNEDASTATQRVALTEAAARTGLEHAVEQILADYAGASIEVRSDSASAAAGRGTTVLGAMQHLDGPYRAPFVQLRQQFEGPYTSLAETNEPDADKDVRQENPLTHPYTGWAWHQDRQNFAVYEGLSHYDGRGRYHEPGFANATRPSPATGQPVVPVSFKDRTPAPPERTGAVFFDEQFRRIDSGDPVADRAAAHFRLRYAVGVEDLQGHLLANPQADMRLPDDFRNPPDWMRRGASAFATLVGAMGSSAYAAAKAEHVFLGRGWATNADRGPAGFPATFPLMYRWSDTASGDAFWESYRQPNGWACTNDLFRSSYVQGLAAGGELLYCDGWRWWGPPHGGVWPYSTLTYTHALTGPQLSFWNLQYATQSAAYDHGPDANPTVFALTPFGRSLRRTPNYPADYQPARRRWHQGRVDTPFHVNLMTAPPRVISDMLIAYLPPRCKVFKYTRLDYHRFTGRNANGDDQHVHDSSVPIDGTDPRNNVSYYGRDHFVDASHAGFEFPAPRRDAASVPPSPNGEIISPDYFVEDQRAPADRYPGPGWNGDPANPGEGGDDLGKDIDTNTIGNGVCSHTGLGFLFMGVGQNWMKSGDLNGDAGPLTVTPPAWFWQDPKHFAVKIPDPNLYRFQDSYWWDILSGFTAAVSVMRAQWVQYDNPQFIVAQGFPAGALDPARHRTLRDVDRLLLAELGESLDAPGSGAPATLGLTAWRHDRWHDGLHWRFKFVPFSARHNIRSVRDADLLACAGGMTSAERSAVMERVLNDFRMSFLGSSPAYSDGIDPDTGVPDPAREFRPLDFDGDGLVRASAYAGGRAQAEVGGRGPKPDPMMYVSLTGNFFTGKSRYFRVMTRGELWDNRLERVLNDAILESVVAVDPEGLDPRDTQLLYQRWHFDKYRGMMSRIEP